MVVVRPPLLKPSSTFPYLSFVVMRETIMHFFIDRIVVVSSYDFYANSFPFDRYEKQNLSANNDDDNNNRYAITGALPPGGSKAGQNFVHDPRAMDATQVKAQVKLRFTSRSSQSMVVVRSTWNIYSKNIDKMFALLQYHAITSLIHPITHLFYCLSSLAVY